MSSTNRANAQAYSAEWETEPAVATPLFDWFEGWWNERYNRPPVILEPQAGNGNLLRAAADRFPSTVARDALIGVEFNPERAVKARLAVPDAVVFSDNMLTMKPYLFTDFAFGNPPYGMPTFDAEGNMRLNSKGKPILTDAVEAHVRAAMKWLRPGGILAYLLRNNWIVPQARDKLLAEFPLAAQAVVRPRPAFFEGDSGGKTDSVEYAWSIWRKPDGPVSPDRPDPILLHWTWR